MRLLELLMVGSETVGLAREVDAAECREPAGLLLSDASRLLASRLVGTSLGEMTGDVDREDLGETEVEEEAELEAPDDDEELESARVGDRTLLGEIVDVDGPPLAAALLETAPTVVTSPADDDLPELLRLVWLLSEDEAWKGRWT